jgi:hypothetical protein
MLYQHLIMFDYGSKEDGVQQPVKPQPIDTVSVALGIVVQIFQY